MRQLAFDHQFQTLIEEPPKYATTFDEFLSHRKDAENILQFIEDISSHRYYQNIGTEKKHCATCLKELEGEMCSYCKTSHTIDGKMQIEEPSHLGEGEYLYDYYIFDCQKEDVLLYKVEETITYHVPVAVYYEAKKTYTIEAVYQIEPHQIVDLLSKEIYTHEDILTWNDYLNGADIELTDQEIDTYFTKLLGEGSQCSYLYVDHLEDLKQTKLYQYTHIWELKEYFSTKDVTLIQLGFYPICFPQFEYLIKEKLYSMAFGLTKKQLSIQNFSELLPIDKKYYPFMQEVDMNFYEFELYKTCPTFDKSLYDFMLSDLHIGSVISEYVRLDKAKKYLEQYDCTEEIIYQYADYLTIAKDFGYDLKDKKYLFPKNLKETYYNLYLERLLAKDHEIEKKIKALSSVLNLNSYETKDYIIFPASSVQSLIEESEMQHNCVRMYCKTMADNESQIYFLRKKSNLQESFITIEVVDNRVVQAKTKYNKEPSKEMKMLIHQWSKTLLPVVSEE